MIIFSIFSYLLDLLLNYYLPIFINIRITPMFFVTFLIVYLIINYKDKKTYYYLLTSSIIYDLFFGNIFLLYTFIFIILYYVITLILHTINNCYLTHITIYMFSLLLFIFLKYLLSLLMGYSYSNHFLLTQISSALLINLIYAIIIYLLLGIKKKKG